MKRKASRSAELRIIGFALTVLVGTSILPGKFEAAPPQRRAQRARTQKPKAQLKAKLDYTKFSHQTHVVVQKLACNSCHKLPSKNWKEFRKGDAAFPDVTDFPEHSSCLNCHKEQFFARERPAPSICSNCHIAVTPRDTARWLFPNLGDVTDPKLKRRDFVSEFAVAFPHDKHLDVVSFSIPAHGRPIFIKASAHSTAVDRMTGAQTSRLLLQSLRTRTRLRSSLNLDRSQQDQKKAGPPKSCPVCHQLYQPQGNSSEEYLTKPPKNPGDAFWLKKGTFQTIPNSHTICFTCHSADSGLAPEPKDCNVCHMLSSPITLKTDFDPASATTMGADKTTLARWSRRTSAGAFRHEGGEHPDLNCLNCHNVSSARFNTVDPKTMKVPVRSCGGAEGCHITATTDEGGALNFEMDSRKKDPKFVCTKCHITFGKEPIPENHPAAVTTPKPKVKPS